MVCAACVRLAACGATVGVSRLVQRQPPAAPSFAGLRGSECMTQKPGLCPALDNLCGRPYAPMLHPCCMCACHSSRFYNNYITYPIAFTAACGPEDLGSWTNTVGQQGWHGHIGSRCRATGAWVNNHEFMAKVLSAMNIPDGFIRLVQCCYASNRLCVKVNGHLGERSAPKNGVKQGCPLNSLLYVCAFQPFL